MNGMLRASPVTSVSVPSVNVCSGGVPVPKYRGPAPWKTSATPVVWPTVSGMLGIVKGSDTPLVTGPCVTFTIPSDVQPAGELPGPLATGPPRPDPTRVKTSIE
ncbi:hypothetical protein J4558_18340 [Leptolyngbya sp. 15MV]|nr:hypothetical protein J4558_18340 [Leptolyngbya sp. 15MV]